LATKETDIVRSQIIANALDTFSSNDQMAALKAALTENSEDTESLIDVAATLIDRRDFFPIIADILSLDDINKRQAAYNACKKILAENPKLLIDIPQMMEEKNSNMFSFQILRVVAQPSVAGSAEFLSAFLRGTVDEMLQKTAIESLLRYQSYSSLVLQRIVKSLESNNPEMRSLSAKALQGSKETSVVPNLIDALDDLDETVINAVHTALEKNHRAYFACKSGSLANLVG